MFWDSKTPPWQQLEHQSTTTNCTQLDIYWPTFETWVEIILDSKVSVFTTWCSPCARGGWIDGVVVWMNIENREYTKNNGQWWLNQTHPLVLALVRVSDFCALTSGQVPIAKVLLGILGVAVVVVLIAVPTAIHLRGESAILFKCWHSLVHHLCSAAPLNAPGKNRAHALLPMIRLDPCLLVQPVNNKKCEDTDAFHVHFQSKIFVRFILHYIIKGKLWLMDLSVIFPKLWQLP